ncbi:calcium/calmodulin-dependent 3',5'-cyclic nucleotide phosphodiesterase 1B-like [Sphaerodactylus townsendi]|uniref:calcium/calmodulin-dependent 3',5'-cyclic nucleotide phosphodiesterase 1B-like n=1 Tax=Sphaerodactylus townsendi TaxID=933632 RepID=UPI00202765A7|nr:calcium/calmodulin-dependent 3',5'-cyclic nucleotide phosphodiesterase 1B-like [Sphaerodactylus townsendi]
MAETTSLEKEGTSSFFTKDVTGQPDGEKEKEKCAGKRLRYMVKQLETGEVDIVELKKNLEYTASLLEAVYIDETRQILDTEDELQEIKSDAVPSEVRDWLASTFTQQTRAKGRRSEEKPKFRSIVHAVQAGIFVERMFRRTYTAVGPNYSQSVINCLKFLTLFERGRLVGLRGQGDLPF